jgi:hypothetical protein
VRPSGNDSLPDDPLLHFTEQLDAGQLDGHSETANLTSLFACAGAVADNLSPRARKPLPILNSCLDMLRRPPSGWKLVQPVWEMRSRIALLRRGRKHSRQVNPESIRLAWLHAGFAVSAYGDGTVRLSFPQDLS